MKNRYIIRFWLLFFLLSNGLTLLSQQTNLFLSLRYDKVLIYEFEPEFPDNSILNKNGKLTAKILKTATLKDSDINILNHKLGQRKSFGGGTRDCFIPHLGIVYYYKKSPVAFLNVCMDCNRMYASIPIIGKKYGQFYRGPNTYYLKDDGMSNVFRKFLKNLLITNNFSHIPQD